VVTSDLDPLVVAEDVTEALVETLRRQWLDCPAKTQKRFSVRVKSS